MLTWKRPVTAEALEALRLRLSAARAVRTEAPRPFAIVTPLGRERIAEIRVALKEHAIAVLDESPIVGWPERASAIYVPSTEIERLHIAIGFEDLWREKYPPAATLLWLSPEDHLRMTTLKYPLRERFASVRVSIDVGTRVLQSSLHSIHVPDAANLPLEHAIMAR